MDQLSDKSVQCVVVTPEKTVLDEPVDFVAIPLYDGELGVLPGRAPLIGRLGAGELRTKKGHETQRYFIDGGFAQVRSNVVTVLTSKAIKAQDIDPAKVRAEMEAAKSPATTVEERDIQQKILAKGRVQLRVAGKGADTYSH